ncbi:MAG: DUF3048 domain-containing protein [Clostridiales bacterium]|nr:DUF3048 domain-containing protein [Clostridiales bacterium]
MKKQIQTLAALIAGVTIITPLSLCSCGKSEETTTSATTAATTTTTTEATTTTESTDATTEETKAIAEVTENPLIDPKNPLALDPYTGIQDMDPKNVGKRSIACTISNLEAATPSKGTAKADIIYEYETEGGQTRLLCLFPDISKVEVIGSFRSARVVAADLADGTNSILVHWGFDQTKFPAYFKEYNIDHIDMNEYDAGWLADTDGKIELNGNKFSWRDLHWKKEDKRVLQDCAVTNGEQVQRAIDFLGINTKTEEIPMVMNFVPDGTAPMKDAFDCKDLQVYFSEINKDAHFVYNDKDHCYYKSQYRDTPQTDDTTDEQLHFTNVFVLYTNIHDRHDGAGRLDFSLELGGQGYYVSNGKLVEINWIKPNPMDMIQITDKDGKPIEINAGKSYFCMVDIKERSKTSWMN